MARPLLRIRGGNPAARVERQRAFDVAVGIAGLEPDPATDALDFEIHHGVDPGSAGRAFIPYDAALDSALPDSVPVVTTLGPRPEWDIVGLASALFHAREERVRRSDQENLLHRRDVRLPGLYTQPWLDHLAGWLVERAGDAAQEQGVPSGRLMPWPTGDWAFCVTSDADEIRWSWRRRLLAAATRPWRLIGPSRYWNVPRLAKRLEQAGMRGTFFVGFQGARRPHDIQYDAEEIRGPLCELIAAGHEVGLHGSLGTARDATMLREQRVRLEQVLDQKVTSTRQHFLDADPGRTWSIQVAAGLRFDSTAQVRALNGFKHGTAHPFEPVEGLLEIAPVVMDSYLHSDGRSLEDALAELRALQDAVKATGGALVLNWHNEWYHPQDRPAFVATLESVLAGLGSPPPFHATVEGLGRWWLCRSRMRLQETSRGLRISAEAGIRFAVELLGPWDAQDLHCQGGTIEGIRTGPRNRPIVSVKANEGVVELSA